MKASSMVEIGLSTVMCFTRERFQANRITNVLIRMLSIKTRNSTSISDLVWDLATSLIILLSIDIFFYIDYK